MCQVRLAKIDIETRKKGIGGVSSYQKERRFGHLIRAKHGPTQVCVVVSIRHRRTAVQAVGMRQVRCFVDGNADAGRHIHDTKNPTVLILKAVQVYIAVPGRGRRF